MGQIHPGRLNPDYFDIQGYDIIRNKNLDTRLLRPWQKRYLSSFRYVTRFRKSFKVHMSLIDTEYNLAKFCREQYGYGEFGILFKDRYKVCHANKTNHAKRIKYIRPYTKTRRAIVLIKQTYNEETGDDFIYHYNPLANKMYMMPFWKGAVKCDRRKKKEKEEQTINTSICETKEGFTKL